MESLIEQNNLNEAIEILSFMQQLDPENQKFFCQFIEGAKYGISLATKMRENKVEAV